MIIFLIYSDRNISVPPFTFFSSPPSLHYVRPFRNISCSTFTIWCNKHKRYFTVTHNTLPFCCTTKFLFSHITCCKFLHFHYFLTLLFIYSLLFLSPSFWPPHLHTVYHSRLIKHPLFSFRIQHLKLVGGTEVQKTCQSLYYCGRT